jgi:hypothetical protein
MWSGNSIRTRARRTCRRASYWRRTSCRLAATRPAGVR